MSQSLTSQIWDDPLGTGFGLYERWVAAEATKEAAKTPASSKQAQDQVLGTPDNQTQNPNAQTTDSPSFFQEQMAVGGIQMNKAALYLAIAAVLVIVLVKVAR
jgi:hypothetical protein